MVHVSKSKYQVKIKNTIMVSGYRHEKKQKRLNMPLFWEHFTLTCPNCQVALHISNLPRDLGGLWDLSVRTKKHHFLKCSKTTEPQIETGIISLHHFLKKLQTQLTRWLCGKLIFFLVWTKWPTWNAFCVLFFRQLYPRNQQLLP